MDNHQLPKGATCWEGCLYIGNPSIKEEAAPYSEKKVVLDDSPIFATVHVCLIGYHKLYLNGIKADDIARAGASAVNI
jgi:hypothetical protein